jgi:uncharacterized protein YjdB
MPRSRLPLAAAALCVSACTNSATTPSTTTSTTPTTTTAPAPSAAFAPSISFTGGDVFVVGERRQLTAFDKSSATASQDITATATWQSSNPSVATVSGGLVTAIATGSTVITASDQTATGSLVLTVVTNTVKSLLVVGPPTMVTGTSTVLTADATTTAGQTVETTGVAWQSSKPSVATVAADGTLTAVAPGTATVSATFQGATGTLTVTVADLNVTSIGFYGSVTVTRGLTTQLTATATLAGGSSRIVTNLAVWNSLNTDIATVSSSGLVTAASTAGTATITATYLGVTGSVDITVQ